MGQPMGQGHCCWTANGAVLLLQDSQWGRWVTTEQPMGQNRCCRAANGARPLLWGSQQGGGTHLCPWQGLPRGWSQLGPSQPGSQWQTGPWAPAGWQMPCRQ